MAPPKQRINPHTLARDATFRPNPKPATGPGGVTCKACGSDQVIPIPIWDLSGESDEPGVWVVPLALVCLNCWTQSVYQARWREEGDGDG